jgi:SAM-dependent methyltransferase
MPKSDVWGLYQVPDLYEALLGADGSDLPYYRALAAESGGPILDLACGSGRLSLALAAEGHAVCGLDKSAPMLAEARRRARAAGLSVEWVEAELADFRLPRRFRLALLAYNGLQHLLDDAALQGFLNSVAACLQAGGRLALDLHVPQSAILGRDPDTDWPVTDGPTYGMWRVVSERSRYDAKSGILTQCWTLRGPSGVFTESLALRQFPVESLRERFLASGWRVLGLYEDFLRRPLGPTALRQVWLLEVPSGS